MIIFKTSNSNPEMIYQTKWIMFNYSHSQVFLFLLIKLLFFYHCQLQEDEGEEGEEDEGEEDEEDGGEEDEEGEEEEGEGDEAVAASKD